MEWRSPKLADEGEVKKGSKYLSISMYLYVTVRKPHACIPLYTCNATVFACAGSSAKYARPAGRGDCSFTFRLSFLQIYNENFGLQVIGL